MVPVQKSGRSDIHVATGLQDAQVAVWKPLYWNGFGGCRQEKIEALLTVA